MELVKLYENENEKDTVKLVLGRHPGDPGWCPLNTGYPLKTSSLRICLKRIILIFVSLKDVKMVKYHILVNGR